ncbi:hypothetical protein D6C88_01212 [Aureobasidium pullulans]|nr:hypothetical protein D6C88_01212 [Aureobasidium pullulans]
MFVDFSMQYLCAWQPRKEAWRGPAQRPDEPRLPLLTFTPLGRMTLQSAFPFPIR